MKKYIICSMIAATLMFITGCGSGGTGSDNPKSVKWDNAKWDNAKWQ